MQYFIQTKENRKTKISMAVRAAFENVEFMTDEELLTIPVGSFFVFDIECYVNFFYIAFKCLLNGKYVAFEQSADFELNKDKLNWMLWRFTIIGFNSSSYDVPMLAVALKGMSCKQLKEVSDFIIQSGVNYDTKKTTPFDVENKYKVKIEKYNHIDLFNVCPVNGGVSANPASLKLYAGRMHSPRMQDLPFTPAHILSAADAAIVRPYCCNDLNNTELLFNELLPEIKLRCEMSEEYGLDLRSKSDAQIAEAVINSELQKVLGYYPKRPQVSEGLELQYNVPDFIKFESEELNAILEKIRNASFKLDALGSPTWPEGLGVAEKTKGGKPTYVLKTKLGNMVYKLGMGGLHSTEKTTGHVATDEIIIADNDVESFYPRIILNQKLFPEHLGKAFLTVYEKIVNTRVHAKGEASKAKKAGDKAGAKRWKTIADTLKIVINGSFGKLGNKYSTLYAPQLMLQVTITGQLVLLMLIELLTKAGIEVFSGNTDGIISKYNKSRHDEVRAIIAKWEKDTNFKTEETRYSAVYSRDVNSYVAVKAEGGDPEARFLDEKLGCKTKGEFCERGSALNSILSKTPEALICSDACLEMIVNKKPIEETIKQCKDIKRFVSIRSVKGGGEKDGIYLGKVVRWYYAKGEYGCISYVGSGNKVASTDGAKPVMDLPKEFPEDINYEWYIKTAKEMLFNCGFYKKPTTEFLF